jgi:uncharacterized membrane protein YgdD (TMEM256/DUF423 family)
VITPFVRAGAILAFLGVALGAFGAHVLQEQLGMSARWLEVYRTGVQYHLIHAVALLFVGMLAERFPDRPALRRAGWLFVAGIIVFAGSLYALALTSLLPSGPVRVLGAITPLGGVCFLVGWALLAIGVSSRLSTTAPNR